MYILIDLTIALNCHQAGETGIIYFSIQARSLLKS